jgi:hypothetical protein
MEPCDRSVISIEDSRVRVDAKAAIREGQRRLDLQRMEWPNPKRCRRGGHRHVDNDILACCSAVLVDGFAGGTQATRLSAAAGGEGGKRRLGRAIRRTQ